jgi:hypothetical protein
LRGSEAIAVADADWSPLDAALDGLECRGGQARFWWRDDDAVEDTAQLQRLIAVSQRFQAPVLLAVIPARAQPSLALRLGDTDAIVPAVHGYAHVNHAGSGEKKQELCGHREPAVVAAELSRGFERLSDLFGKHLAPVLVPPWNRIAPEVGQWLPGIGFEGLSVFGPEEKTPAFPGLSVANTHLDPIDWRGSRSLADVDFLIEQAAAHVRRCVAGDVDRPFGLLTHHLVHDDAIWGFVEALLARTAGRAGVVWCEPRSVFGR